MVWQKIGRIYDPNSKKRHPKLETHSANPLPVHMKGDIFRVFYSARDSKKRSSVGAFDFDIKKLEIVYDHYEPFFVHGPKGTYYESGVSVGGCYSVGNITYMLFMGWQNENGKHWRGDIGRLTLSEDLGLSLKDNTPLITISDIDPVSLSYPFVVKKNSEYKMWYGSTLKWESRNTEMVHVINSATSLDGDIWNLDGLAIPYYKNVCQAFSRPTVLVNNDESYDMWFSFRSGLNDKYKIGHAYSLNSLDWEIDLSPKGLETSKVGWDSDMMEYPYAIDHKGKRYMFYNGNGYGNTGIGLAMFRSQNG